MKTRNLILAAILAVAFAASAQAAAITWTDGTFTSDAILPTHDVGYAVGFGNGTAVTTAIGVTFGADNQTNVTFSTANNFYAYLGGGGTTGDPGFDTVLNHGDWGIPGTLTLNNLVIGAQYQVMLFVDDTRFAGGCCAGRTGSVSDGPADGSHSSSTITFSFAAGSPAIGAYYSGTFTANATTQQIVVNNGGGNQIDGLVLVAPEPASLRALRPRSGRPAAGRSPTPRSNRPGLLPGGSWRLTQTASAANINVLLS